MENYSISNINSLQEKNINIFCAKKMKNESLSYRNPSNGLPVCSPETILPKFKFIMLIKLLVGEVVLTVLSVYAPQTGLEESTKDAFYDSLQTVTRYQIKK